jgi:hypothetical protein
MKTSQGNQHIATFNKQKISYFFYKNRKQEGRTGHVWGVGTSQWGKNVERESIWCKYCVHMDINGKVKPVETIPGVGKGE